MAFGKRYLQRNTQSGLDSHVTVPVTEVGGCSQPSLDSSPVVPKFPSGLHNEAKCNTDTIQDGNTESIGVQPGGAASSESDVSEESDDELIKSPSSAAVEDDKVCQNENIASVTSTHTPTQSPIGEPRTLDVGDTVPQDSFQK